MGKAQGRIANAGAGGDRPVSHAGQNTAQRSDSWQSEAAWVMDIMESRLTGLGVGWDQVTATDVYTVHPLRDIVEGVLLPRMGAAVLKGMTWHYSRPPIVDIEFEMDLRGVAREVVI